MPPKQSHKDNGTCTPFAIIDFLWGCNLLWRYDLQTHTWLKRHGFSSSPNAPAPVDGTSSSPFHVHVGPVDGPMALAHPWSDLMARDARSENSKESSANHHNNEQPAVCSFWKQWHCHVNLHRWLAMNGLMIYLSVYVWKSYLFHGYIIPCYLVPACQRHGQEFGTPPCWDTSPLSTATATAPKPSENKIPIPISFIVKLILPILLFLAPPMSLNTGISLRSSWFTSFHQYFERFLDAIF